MALADKIIHNFPGKAKSDVWESFGLYKREGGSGDLDKTKVICRQCRTELKYQGNTTNLKYHLSRYHQSPLAPTFLVSQPTITQSLGKLPPKSLKAQALTKSIAEHGHETHFYSGI